jgi:hypothetical protein
MEATAPDQATQAFVGWLPKSQLFDWNTRQAVEYDWETRPQRRTPAPIFRERTSAERSMDLGQPGAKDDVYIAQEDLSYVGRFKPEVSRYPLLEAFDTPSKLGKLYSIGFIGGFYGKGGSADAKTEWETQDFKRRQAALAQLQLDLVIVIDGTHSMLRFRDPALEAVNNILANVRSHKPSASDISYRDDDIRTRVSICVYRNFNDPVSGEFSRFQRLPFKWLDEKNHPGDMQEIRKFVNGIHFGSTQTRREEGLYYGIQRAAQDALPEQNDNPLAYRMMVVIGDSGNFSGNLSSEAVAATLNDKHYDFHALSVVTTKDMENRPDFRNFRLEMIELAGKNEKVRATVGETFDPSQRLYTLDSGDFVTKMNDAYTNGLASRTTLAKAILNPNQFPTILKDYVRKYLLDNKIDIDLLEKNQIQLFGEGWTTQYSAERQSQWRVEELVNFDDLRNYVTKLQMFSPYGSDGLIGQMRAKKQLTANEVDAMVSAIEQTFSLKAGEFRSTKTTVAKLLGDASRDLPVHSMLLNLTYNELQAFLQRNDPASLNQRVRELHRIGVCYDVLNAHVKNAIFEYKTNDRGFVESVTLPVTDAKGDYWRRRGRLEYAWIPEEFFP